MDAANYLECETGKDIISYYIFEKLNLKNYIFFYKLTKKYHIEHLNTFLCNVLLQQYLLKENVNLFYELNLQDLCKILSCSELQLSSELELFNAAVDWINYHPKERRKHMNVLLTFIRLPLLSSKILTDVIKNHKLCKSCINCKDTIDRAIKSKNSCTNKTSNIQFQNRYYSCKFENNHVFLVGGIYDISGTNNYEQTANFYTIDGNNSVKSKTTTKMQKLRNNCKAVAIGSKVFCFGGRDPQYNSLNSCEVYCRKSDTWNLVAPFPGSNIEYCCVCSFMNKIYVLGDFWCNNWVYDPRQNKWERIKSCTISRNGASCTVFQGQCLVIGGRKNGCFGEELQSVESYDHYLKKWTFLADVQVARYEAGVVTKRNKIFVIGGFLESTCEVYNSISQKFTYIAGLKLNIHNCVNPIIIGDCIVVYDENYIYKYDIEKNDWLKNEYESSTKLQNDGCSFVKIHKLLE